VTLYASLDGTQVIRGTITIPFSGIWMADLVLQSPKDVTGPRALVLSDAKFQCTVIRAIDFAGSRGVRIVGGMAGWRTQIPAKQYGSWGVAVSLSTVLQDAAAAVGEKLVLAKDGALPSYVRRQGAASDVLNERLGSTWWMDFDGIVQTKPRDVTPIASDFIAESVIGAQGIWKISTEAVKDWLPGRTFKGPTSSGVISRVQHVIANDSLRSLVHTSP
jgi:hypothetical protein